jgi:tight adherence protein B
MPDDIVSFGAALLGAVAIAALAYSLLYPYLSADRETEGRVKGVIEPRRAALTQLEQAASRRKSVADTLKDIEDRQKAAERVTLRLRLARAGLQISPRVFWLSSFVCGATLALFVLLLLPPSATRLFLMIAVGLIGVFGVPRWFVNRLTRRRQQRFVLELPNALDVVVRGIKSGLPLNECLGIVARESAEPLASEFREVIEQQRVGVPLGESLDKLTNRMPLPEVKFLGIVIAIQQQSGGNLSEALSNLSGVLRDRVRLQMKVQALSAEAKASAMVLASLPPGVMVMLYLTTPDYVAPLLQTRVGNFALLACGIWMLMGVMVMKKMINFKF